MEERFVCHVIGRQTLGASRQFTQKLANLSRRLKMATKKPKTEKSVVKKAGPNGGARPGAGRKPFEPTDHERKQVEAMSGYGVPIERIAVAGDQHFAMSVAQMVDDCAAGIRSGAIAGGSPQIEVAQ
ncbi:MAG: hypothetical protein ACLGG4_08685 [Gammaproteobacteria bacterium]